MSAITHDADHDHDHKPTGLKRWFFSTNHKFLLVTKSNM